MPSSRLLRGFIITVTVLLGLFVLSFVIAISNISTFAVGEKIGVIEIEGVITDAKEINEQIRNMGERKDIKAIILRIDSPGGGVVPSQEIYEEVKRVGKGKKVVASIGSVAASGGYYIAVAAERIVANPGSVTGSIGVLINFADVQELLRKVGVKGYVIKSGEYKDIGSPLREMREGERRLIKGLISDIHGQFVDVVSENREIEKRKVEEIADGRIFTGKQALSLRLVDSLGSFYDAVSLVSEIADIKGKPVLVYPEKRWGLLELLFGGSLKGLLKGVYSINYSPQFLYYSPV